MALDFYLNVTDEQYDNIKNLNSLLGMALFNIAVLNAPIDTGNLRRSITLASNTSKKINVRYNLSVANYAKFLELGVGPVKKYKGFISQKTTASMVEEIISFIKSGKISSWTYGVSPVVLLKRTSHIFGQERKVIEKANIKARNTLTANQRKQISKIREKDYQKSLGNKVGSVKGKNAITITKNEISGSRVGRLG